MQATFSYCNWRVTRSKGAVSAISNWDIEREVVELPFQPSFVPKWGVAACETDEGTELAEPPQQAVRAFVATDGGFLVGYNSGEWGGGLYSYAKSGELLQEILVDNVIRIVKLRDGYLVFTGIAHLFTDRGEVVFVKRDRDGWRIAHRLDLTGKPRAFLDESERSMLVATDDRIVRVTNGRRVEVLYGNRHRFWEPHSIVKDRNGTLYLGARYIVVRLRPRAVDYVETWLAPEGATAPRPATE
jgi:hypothetical protein